MLRFVRLFVRPSICLSHSPISITMHSRATYNRSPIGNPTCWKPTLPSEMAETATKPSSAPLQKHSLAGCTVDTKSSIQHLSDWHRGEAHVVSPRDTSLQPACCRCRAVVIDQQLSV